MIVESWSDKRELFIKFARFGNWEKWFTQKKTATEPKPKTPDFQSSSLHHALGPPGADLASGRTSASSCGKCELFL